MAKFFVGQRVRVIWANRSGLAGRQGVISEIIGPVPEFENPGFFRYGYGLDISPIWHDGESFVSFADDQLEPILDTHEPCDADFKQSLDKLLEGLPA